MGMKWTCLLGLEPLLMDDRKRPDQWGRHPWIGIVQDAIPSTSFLGSSDQSEKIMRIHFHTNVIDLTPTFISQYAMDSLAVDVLHLVQKKRKEGQEVRRV
ncbi:hypothetical protein F2Q69_00048858 [Brassica cretica]|uniref:Uncharacterized protein n=1 Tax=Brassica cretica TaxID=69181 RepID=A0A8S9PMS2_BRACR|nr:hypothetical protein F2Q69_00048858 [Brassica cretica]